MRTSRKAMRPVIASNGFTYVQLWSKTFLSNILTYIKLTEKLIIIVSIYFRYRKLAVFYNDMLIGFLGIFIIQERFGEAHTVHIHIQINRPQWFSRLTNLATSRKVVGVVVTTPRGVNACLIGVIFSSTFHHWDRASIYQKLCLLLKAGSDHY